jgi:hypothetical protein
LKHTRFRKSVCEDVDERDDDGNDERTDSGVLTGNANINEAGVTPVVACGVVL